MKKLKTHEFFLYSDGYWAIYIYTEPSSTKEEAEVVLLEGPWFFVVGGGGSAFAVLLDSEGEDGTNGSCE